MFDTILHYISVASPYVCGFWAVLFMFFNHKLQKNYLLERSKIRQILKDEYSINLDDVLQKISVN